MWSTFSGGKNDGLTDQKLLSLCGCFNSSDQLRRFASCGLEIKLNKVDDSLEKHKGDLHEATYDVLKEWRLSQPDPVTAKVNITKALKDADMVSLLKVIE